MKLQTNREQEALRTNSTNITVDGAGDAPPQYSLYSHQPYVTYEIHLHPTYRMPTLWFTLHDLPLGDSPLDITSVYRYLVPEQHKSHLRAVGIIGGISADVSCPKWNFHVSPDSSIAPSCDGHPSLLYSPMPD